MNTLAALFIALAVERFGDERLLAFRQGDHLQRYLAAMARLLRPCRACDGPPGVALMLLPLLAGVHLVYGLFDGWFFGLAGLVMATVLLLYSLGPEDVERALRRYRDASDEATRAALFHALADGEPMPLDAAQRSARLAELACRAATRRLFAVLFWFALGGPLAALAYRLSRALEAAGPGLPSGLQQAAHHWLALLDWAPARLLVLTLALTGPFEPLWHLLRAGLWCHPSVCPEVTARLLEAAGRGCLAGEDPVAWLAQAERLLQRALLVWLAVMAALVVLAP